MSDFINKAHHIQEKTRLSFYPDGCYVEYYHTPVVMLLFTAILLKLLVINVDNMGAFT